MNFNFVWKVNVFGTVQSKLNFMCVFSVFYLALRSVCLCMGVVWGCYKGQKPWLGLYSLFHSLVLEMLSELQGSACLPSTHLMWLVETRIQVFMVAQEVPEPLLHSLYLTLWSQPWLACQPSLLRWGTRVRKQFPLTVPVLPSNQPSPDTDLTFAEGVAWLYPKWTVLYWVDLPLSLFFPSKHSLWPSEFLSTVMDDWRWTGLSALPLVLFCTSLALLSSPYLFL